MSPLVVLFATWGTAGVVVGWLFSRRDWKTFLITGAITRLRPWENKKRYERLLLVRGWKDLLPEAGTWFGGVSKRHLLTIAEGGRTRFGAESLRAERVHLTLLLVVPITLIWSRGWWMLITIMIGVVMNVPCIIVARYNRVRLALLA
jgi:glycosyl-4,4'-diaponeurosporenoate acyltransferase